jgi:hypothetical protein
MPAILFSALDLTSYDALMGTRAKTVLICFALAACGDHAVPLVADGSVDSRNPNPIDAASDAPLDAHGPQFHLATSIDLAHRPAGKPSTLLVAVTNDDSIPLTFNKASIGGPFAITSDDCSTQPLAPGAQCAIGVGIVAAALGPKSGALFVSVGTTTVVASLTAIADAYVAADSTVHGHVDVSPASTTCYGCYAGGTQVTLTAVPDADSHLVGWSNPACSGMQCVVTAGLAPQDITATFALNTNAFTIDFVGTGPGDVVVNQGQLPPITCSASCTVAVDDSVPIDLVATTPVDLVGFGTPCPANQSSCTLPAGSTAITVDFELTLGEQIVVVGDVSSVDFDPANELVIGGSTIRAFTSTLAPKWTASYSGLARFAANGDVIVVTASDIVKLAAADGHLLWSQPTTALYDAAHFWYGPLRQFAATPDGGVILNHGDSLDLWTSDGSTVSHPTLGRAGRCVATGADGRLYVGVDEPMGVTTSYEVFTSAGVHQLPDFIYSSPDIGVPNEGCNTIGVGSSRLAVSTKSELNDRIGFVQYGLDRTRLGQVIFTLVGQPIDPAEHGVASNSSDDIAFFLRARASSTITGLFLSKYDASLALLKQVTRPSIGPPSYQYGVNYIDMAMANDGRIAVGLDYQSVSSGYSIIDVFSP